MDKVNDRNATFRLHYDGVLVSGLATEYRDFDYVNIEREEHHVCRWSFTTDLTGLGFKDEDVNGLYHKESTKAFTDGLRIIDDETSLYEVLTCASRTELVKLYVEHSEDRLWANNKLVDMNITTRTCNVSEACKVAGDYNEMHPNQNIDLISSDKDEGNKKTGIILRKKEKYLDNSDVESLNEKILEDVTSEIMRTCVKFPRYGENCKTKLEAERDPFDFVDKCYSKDMFIVTYSYPIEVVASKELWTNSGSRESLPPLPKAMSGRPRKARRKKHYKRSCSSKVML
uniref:Elongation factor G, III-V domain-containing protein n=1 Tax=Tanacetum cinerariifolium TaxID=118510 RepID=A0A6L2JT13_TANCI|nr:elongation factor G, III-V domain-containing protein [Tanacetum cinerariifolium]